jgi:hypothetical protein
MTFFSNIKTKLISSVPLVILAFCLYFYYENFETYISNELVLSTKTSQNFLRSTEALEGAYSFDTPYFYETEKNILERNIFNLTGQWLDLEEEDTSSRDPSQLPCTNKTLPFTVIGAISSNRPKSGIVTILNPQTKKSDVLKPGAKVPDHPSLMFLGAVNGYVEFYDGTDKICLALMATRSKSRAQFSTSKADNYVLDKAYVEQELGDGFLTVLENVQFMPYFVARKFAGIKIYDLVPNTLFGKIGLQKADIILRINTTELDDPSKGFELLRAFKEDSEVELLIQRNDNQMIKKVTIR